MDIVYIGNEIAYIKLDDFVLESYNKKNQSHVVLTEKLINSENSPLSSYDINQIIINIKKSNKEDFTSDVYVVQYRGDLIGLAFVNLNKEIELRVGLIDEYKDMNLEVLLEKELSKKLLEIYPSINVPFPINDIKPAIVNSSIYHTSNYFHIVIIFK